MHTARDGHPIRSHHIQFHRVLIDLRHERWSRNGEGKRVWGLSITRQRFCPFTHGHQFRLTPQPMHFLTHLIVGGKRNGFSGLLRQSLGQSLHLCVLVDGRHGEARREQIQPTNALLEGRMKSNLPGPTPIGNTRDHSQFTRALHQTAERRGSHTQGFRGRTHLCSSQHRFHGPQILEIPLLLALFKTGGIKGRTRDHRRRRWLSWWFHCHRDVGKRVGQRIKDDRWSIRWE